MTPSGLPPISLCRPCSMSDLIKRCTSVERPAHARLHGKDNRRTGFRPTMVVEATAANTSAGVVGGCLPERRAIGEWGKPKTSKPLCLGNGRCFADFSMRPHFTTKPDFPQSAGEATTTEKSAAEKTAPRKNETECILFFPVSDFRACLDAARQCAHYPTGPA
ncbi:hypothetical protein FQR65_LT20470 [Abscondita terminalis]|nr:hypothetical protein FQR65_LT20470 [Abscondita terminalis]